MEYLEKIYTKSKADGHFNKFDNYTDFAAYFKDVDSYKKLWRFLISKEYKILELDAFIKKITDETPLAEIKVQKSGIYNQPLSAVNIIECNDGLKKLPDIIRVGGLKAKGFDEYIPALIPFRGSNGICYLFNDDKQKDIANKSLQVLAYRLLLAVPNRQTKFYIVDNEKNGSSFSSLFGLDDKILHHEIWDDEQKITNGLNDIKNQVPVILSRQLQNKYIDLADYNEKISHSSQPFQFILIANYPRGFNQDSSDKLLNLIENGHKAGVYVLMSVNEILPLPYGINVSNFRELVQSINLNSNTVKNIPNQEYFNQLFYISDYDIELPQNLDIIKKEVNKEINEVKSVTVNISNSISNEWEGNASNGVKIPIGVGQNNEIFDFVFGLNSDSYHALIGGATGSGKSVLLHSIIVNGSYIYSPENLQFILLDYKEGTEFKIYENLPHTKILSIASEREFGLSVFEFLVDEITERGKLFKDYGVGNLKEYIEKSGNILPRYLVIIDEFQVLLSGNDKYSSKASMLLEDISRRGRSFGVNMILATQSLGDVDISSSTLSNIGLRIGMKMTEMDCSRILSNENDIPLTFSRPGEAVYNTQFGLKAGNKLFQCAFISKDDIEKKVNYLKSKATEIVFKRFISDGSKIAKLEDNVVLQEQIKNDTFKVNDSFCDIFIGEPTTIREQHVNLRIRKHSESNIFIAGDDPLSVISLIYYSLSQLIRQSSEGSQFYVFDLFDEDGGYQGALDDLKEKTPNIKIYSKDKPVENLLEKLKAELDLRINEEESKGRIILAIINLQNIESMRKDCYSDYSPLAQLLEKIIKIGPKYGIHTFMHIQNYNQLMEIFNSKILNEFENQLILKGEDASRYIDDYTVSPVKNLGTAYLKSPLTDKSFQLIKLYQKEIK